MECELRINGSLREVWMRARVFGFKFQISFSTFSHNDDQNISSECKSRLIEGVEREGSHWMEEGILRTCVSYPAVEAKTLEQIPASSAGNNRGGSGGGSQLPGYWAGGSSC